MTEINISSLGANYQSLFSYLADVGFATTVEMYSPEAFGNFVVACQKSDTKLRVTNERSQIFVEVMTGDGRWLEKETIFGSAGIDMARHATIDGLWSGYEPAKVESDLRANMQLLIEAANSSLE